jgi:hypothetical protein
VFDRVFYLSSKHLDCLGASFVPSSHGLAVARHARLGMPSLAGVLSTKVLQRSSDVEREKHCLSELVGLSV